MPLWTTCCGGDGGLFAWKTTRGAQTPVRKTRVGIASGGHDGARWLFAMEVKRPWAEVGGGPGALERDVPEWLGDVWERPAPAVGRLGTVGPGMRTGCMVARAPAGSGIAPPDGSFRGAIGGFGVVIQAFTRDFVVLLWGGRMLRRVLPQTLPQVLPQPLALVLPRPFPRLHMTEWRGWPKG